MNARKRTVWIALAAVLAASAAHAAPSRVAIPSGIAIVDTARRLDVNQIVLRVSNDGIHGSDRARGAGGLYYPKGTDKSLIFFASPWLVAYAGGETLGVISQFLSEFGPGAMSGGTYTDPALPQYRVYKVTRFRGFPTDTAHVMRAPPFDPTLDPLLHHSWSEYMAGAAPYGAPVRTYRLPDTATPDPSDSIDVPGPDVLGDAMLWCVYNDADPSLHTVFGGHAAPLGIEIQQSFYAFDAPGPVGNTVFARFRILNRGAHTLDSLLIGLWSDPDLGVPFDDLTGSDSTLGLTYCYNGHYHDNVYGTTPPAIGYVRLAGPAQLGLCGPFKSEERPNIWHSRNILLGLHTDGSPLLDPLGNPRRVWYDGDPVTGTGWLDQILRDRRMLLSLGPLTMAPGDTQTVDAAIVIGQGVDNLASVANLKCAAGAVKQFYAAGFPTGTPPGPACPTTAIESCPRDLEFWRQQCATMSSSDLLRIAQCVDESATTISWPGMEQFFCLNLESTANDPVSVVYREYMVFLANVCAAKLGIVPMLGGSVFLGPAIEMWSPSTGARSVAEMAAPSTSVPCHCADSLIQAILAYPEPAKSDSLLALARELGTLNKGFGLGPVCARGTPPSLSSISATETQVDAQWNMGDTGVLSAVYRLDAGAWVEHWRGVPIGTLAFTDTNVVRGQTYRYQVGINPDGRTEYFGEAEVLIPGTIGPPSHPPSSLSMAVLSNPGPQVQVVLGLPSSGSTTVDLFDLRGRLVERQSFASLPPGATWVSIGGPSLKAGIYIVRARHGGQSTSAKAVIVR